MGSAGLNVEKTRGIIAAAARTAQFSKKEKNMPLQIHHLKNHGEISPAIYYNF